MPESITERERFACSRLGRDVTITRKTLIHRNSAGEIDVRIQSELRCESSRDCGVTAKGSDWSKCVHPELGRTG